MLVRTRPLLTSALALTLLAGWTYPTFAQDDIDAEQSQVLEARGDAEFAPDLFAESTGIRAQLDQRQGALYDRLADDPTTLSVRLIDIDISALNGAALRLSPAADVDVLARRTTTSEIEGGFVWVGEMDEVPGTAVLVVKGDRITGNIRADDQLFEISPVDGTHALREVDMTAFPEDHPPEFSEIEDRSGTLDLQDEPADFADLQQRQIDVLVAYTPAAEAAVADIDAHIALAVAENNLANTNSDVNILINPVHVTEVTYTESGNFGTDLARFRTPGDGFMDEVHELRDQHGADMAILVLDNGAYCGLASTILADEATAFAAVHYSCATGYYSFAHELGHLQGARHNPEVDSSTSPFSYGHGMIRPTLSDRSVMAYNCTGGCTRKPYWSGPNVTESGSAFGDAAQRDNTRVLNRTSVDISNFRSPPRQGATAYAWANSPSAASYTPSSYYAHNSSGGDITISRIGLGYYRVLFEGIGGRGVPGGHVQVTGYGSTSGYCKSAGWSSGGDDFYAYVRCFNSAGALADAYYNIFVRWP